nr:MAG TPA_asm: hypothetical protein [Caudoviricetes sp.]
MRNVNEIASSLTGGLTGRHPAQQQQIKPRSGGVFFRLEKCDGNIT